LYLPDLPPSTGNFKKELIKEPETNGNTAKTLATKHANPVNYTTYVLMTKSSAEKGQQE
jgi:hypothetical protein